MVSLTDEPGAGSAVSGRRTHSLRVSTTDTIWYRRPGRRRAEAGIGRRARAYGLRHTMNYELMMEGVPGPIIQRQLGHVSLAATQRYLDQSPPKI